MISAKTLQKRLFNHSRPLGTKSINLDFPCADLTWYYSSSSGKCYKLLSDKPNYSPDEAKDACNEIISAYPKVKVQIAEVRNADQLEALKAMLTSYNVKDRILLNAKREGKPDYWESRQRTPNRDPE
ncbi:hypothetical protein ACTXT7_002642 [Hymenolepis weldensis]